MQRFVCGDVGGTNSRLQLIESDSKSEAGSNERVIAEEVYPSQSYPSLTLIIKKFLTKYVTDSILPSACCLAVAGPVNGNKSQITNVSWIVDGNEISKTLNIPKVLIINDFVGIGYGLLALDHSNQKEVIALNKAKPISGAPKACLGAGTGLGECYLTTGTNSSEYQVFPAEGGHTDFAPRNELEFQLMEFIKNQERVPRVSVERVVSGMGIPKIYDFFASQAPELVSEEVFHKLMTEDKGKVITTYAQNGKCSLCQNTIDTFIKAYGAEAGNLALKTLPFGGLYIAGGIAPKVMWAIKRDNQFMANFLAKGRMQGLLEKVPVYVVTHPNVGLLGARVVCRRLIRQVNEPIRSKL